MTLGSESWHESRPSKVSMVQIWMLSDEWFVRYTPPEKLTQLCGKLCRKCHRCDGCTNEQTNVWTEWQKLYTPHKCLTMLPLWQLVMVNNLPWNSFSSGTQNNASFKEVNMSRDVRAHNINQPHHDKINNMARAPSKDSDQPGHQPSLIRVSTAHTKKPWVPSYPLSAQRSLWSDWLESSLGTQSFCWFCRAAAQIMMM